MDTEWFNSHIIGHPEYMSSTVDGVYCVLHVGNDEKEQLQYYCAICKEPYIHWWCRPIVWNKLPQWVHDKTICRRCFTCIRRVQRESKCATRSHCVSCSGSKRNG